MGNEDIEMKASTILKSCILKSKHLRPRFLENDKTMAYDGQIDIIKDKKKSDKRNVIGSVYVQFKGKYCKTDQFKNSISYPISLDDIIYYSNDRGVIFFVVLIDENNENNESIYYVVLSPVKIKYYIEKFSDQKTKSIQLNKIDEKNNSIDNIVLNACKGMNTQFSFVQCNETITLDELQSCENKAKICIPYYKFNEFGNVGFEQSLLNGDVDIYIKKGNLQIPLEYNENNKRFLSYSNNEPVYINGIKYYDSFKIYKSNNEEKILLGKNLEFISNYKKKETQIRYKISGSMSECLNDLKFINDALNNSGFYLGKYFQKIGESKKSSDENSEIFKEMFEKLDLVKRLFEKLHYYGDLEIEKITEHEWKDIYTLIEALLFDHAVTINNSKSIIVSIKIQNLKFLFFVKKIDDKSNEYKLLDFFENELQTSSTIVDPEKNRISQFAFLKKKDYLEVTNLNFDVLLPSFQKYSDNKDDLYMANDSVLNLINAYDETKKLNYLTTAEKISKWLKNIASEKSFLDIVEMNCFQIIARKRQFSDIEIKRLESVCESDSNNEIKCCAYLLLGNQNKAKEYFEKISVERKIIFTDSPIYKFMKV